MNIKILGTRGAIEPSSPYHSRHSGVLVDGALMLDLGEREFLAYKPRWVCITHLHPDHAFFVADRTKLRRYWSNATLVYAPEKFKKIDIKIFKKKRKFGLYKITPVPTIHSRLVKSQAYIIEKGNKKILYTGDMIWIRKEYHKLFKDLDLVITEASFLRKGGMVRRYKNKGPIWGHNGIQDLIRFFKKFTDHIVFVHFGSWFFKNINKAREEFKKLEKEHNIKIEVGYDGKEIKSI